MIAIRIQFGEVKAISLLLFVANYFWDRQLYTTNIWWNLYECKKFSNILISLYHSFFFFFLFLLYWYIFIVQWKLCIFNQSAPLWVSIFQCAALPNRTFDFYGCIIAPFFTYWFSDTNIWNLDQVEAFNLCPICAFFFLWALHNNCWCSMFFYPEVHATEKSWRDEFYLCWMLIVHLSPFSSQGHTYFYLFPLTSYFVGPF